MYTISLIINFYLNSYNAQSMNTPDEVEVALQVNSTGFVAVGWRPQGMQSSCRQRAPGHYPLGKQFNLNNYQILTFRQ
jgi:hypothetical protein